ncbi:condensation domain-containing protein, partial [Micromonospora sp. NPDC023956]|uniref:condensation domain-containing protein n=1 Tax=Micromonospora sp. NPDC023956 TaxID=3155722 RepID=UPI0033C4AEA4
MNDLNQLLGTLRADGVRLWVHQGRLRYTASRPLAPEMLDTLRRFRTEVVTLLERERPTRETPLADWPRPERIPLSLGQGGMWFIGQLDDRPATYNVTTVLRLEGALDVAALRRAVRELSCRHESLRTTFPTVDGVGVQVVGEATDLTVTDLSGRSERERAARLSALIREHHGRAFALATGPLFLTELVRLTGREHVLVVNAHHIVVDGPSTGILFEELDALYAAFARGGESPLPPPVAQYADYTLWQRAWLQGDELDRQLAYWRSRLAGAAGSLNLPTDFPRPAVGTSAGAMVEFTVPAPVVDGLDGLARTHSATLFTVLLAGFQALLSRWARQEDVSVGLPVDSRGHRDAERLVGYFVNTVVLRSVVQRQATFANLVDLVRDGLAADYEHRDVPFDRVVADLAPDRSLGRHPLFQVMFAYLGPSGTKLGDLRVTTVPAEELTAKFDLTLWVTRPEPGQAARAGFEYARDLFRPETVQRLAASFVALLEGAVGQPGRRVADLPLLSSFDLVEMVRRRSAPPADSWSGRLLHGLFEEQVRRVPGAVAVRVGGVEVSYGEL